MNAANVSAALPLLLLTAAITLAVAALFGQPWLSERRRTMLRTKPFPAVYRRILRRRVPNVARLPSELASPTQGSYPGLHQREALHRLPGTAHHRRGAGVTIAAQACLLLLGHERPDCYPRLRQILVYRMLSSQSASDIREPVWCRSNGAPWPGSPGLRGK